MFNVGGGEVIAILLVALIVLGPDKLPGAVRKAGQVVSEVRKISSGFQAEMRTAMLDDDANRRVGGRDADHGTDGEVTGADGAAVANTDDPASEPPGPTSETDSGTSGRPPHDPGRHQ